MPPGAAGLPPEEGEGPRPSRDHVANALASIGPGFVPVLVETLEQAEPDMQDLAIVALARMGTAPAWEALRRVASETSDARVRQAARKALEVEGDAGAR